MTPKQNLEALLPGGSQGDATREKVPENLYAGTLHLNRPVAMKRSMPSTVIFKLKFPIRVTA